MFETIKYPIIQAPMAGGISTAVLAIAVSESGGLGLLAGGYKTPTQLEEEILQCRNANVTYGVNLFVPSNNAITDDVVNYKKILEKDFEMSLSIDASSDDFWDEKLALVEKYKVPFVSFTFGCPSKEVMKQLKQHDIQIIVTVTTLDEANIAFKNGADALCLQGINAGGHRGSFDNVSQIELTDDLITLQSIIQAIPLPIIFAGGIMNGKQIAEKLKLGAAGVQLGTAFICANESGANPIYKQALLSGIFNETAYTRAFSGRFARGLVNDFMKKYEDVAPACYPAVNSLTQPIRKLALQKEDPQAMSLWAGTGFKKVQKGSATEIMETLINQLKENK